MTWGRPKQGRPPFWRTATSDFLPKRNFFLSGKTASMTKKWTDEMRKTISESEIKR